MYAKIRKTPTASKKHTTRKVAKKVKKTTHAVTKRNVATMKKKTNISTVATPATTTSFTTPTSFTIPFMASHATFTTSHKTSFHPSMFKKQTRMFSTQPNNNNNNDEGVTPTEHIRAEEIDFNTDDVDNVAIEDPNDGQERLPFTVRDALLIKDTLIESIRDDENVKASLKHLGTAHINAMLKDTQIQNLLGSGTLSVIQHLAREGEITLPDIGTGTLAAQNFNTLYQLLELQDTTGTLKQKQTELYCLIMELTFGTDPIVTQNVKISESAALKIAQQYLDAVSSESFYQEVAERMQKYPLPEGGSPLQLKLAHEMRQMELTNVVSPILENIYSKYQYDGAEGFCLMKKAMEDHITNAEVVVLLNKAQQHVIEASGLDQHVILEN